VRPPPDAPPFDEAYRALMESYAIVWSGGGDIHTGRLDLLADGLELHGRGCVVRLHFRDVSGASIQRGRDERLRGLPVLRLAASGGGAGIRIASLQGAGVLHELARHVERAGLTVAA
jgi:hypothetical protein